MKTHCGPIKNTPLVALPLLAASLLLGGCGVVPNPYASLPQPEPEILNQPVAVGPWRNLGQLIQQAAVWEGHSSQSIRNQKYWEIQKQPNGTLLVIYHVVPRSILGWLHPFMRWSVSKNGTIKPLNSFTASFRSSTPQAFGRMIYQRLGPPSP